MVGHPAELWGELKKERRKNKKLKLSSTTEIKNMISRTYQS